MTQLLPELLADLVQNLGPEFFEPHRAGIQTAPWIWSSPNYLQSKQFQTSYNQLLLLRLSQILGYGSCNFALPKTRPKKILMVLLF